MPVEMVPTTSTDVRGSILIVGGAFAWEGDLGLFKVEKAGRALEGTCLSLSVCLDALWLVSSSPCCHDSPTAMDGLYPMTVSQNKAFLP